MDEPRGRSSNPADYGYSYSTPRDQPVPEVGWKDKEADDQSGAINLYSKNVVQENETTESVDRESIANLSTTKQQWESIFSTNAPETQDAPLMRKKPVKWEVKLPDSNRRSVHGDSRSSVTSPLPGDRSPVVMDSAPVKDVSHHNVDAVDASSSVREDKRVSPKGDYESAIEYEIRIACEREAMLQKEKEERARLMSASPRGPSEEDQVKVKSPVPVVSSMEAVSRESESTYQLAYNELTEADRPSGVWDVDANKRDHQENDENPHESIIEREIRLQKEKDAELELQRLKLGQRQSSLSSSSSLPESLSTHLQHEPELQQIETPLMQSPPSERISPMNPIQSSAVEHRNSPLSQGERIARELQELQEREEEMRRMRENLHPGNKNKSPNGDGDTESLSSSSRGMSPLPPEPVNNHNHNHNTVKQTSSSNSAPSPHKPWQKESATFTSNKPHVSQESESSQKGVKPPSGSIATPRSSPVVTTLSNNTDSDEDEKPNYFQKQETPIEREIRLAKERENELRRMKGMPELSVQDDFYGPNQSNPPPNPKSTNKASHYQPPSKQSLKKLSASRLQEEISAQKERDNSMRGDGKGNSDADEQFKPFKYMEITGSQAVDGSEKRNFVTKKTPTHISESHSPTVTPQGGKSNSTAVQSSMKPATSSGSKNFSYKEFRQTAESKIERELREMREREEELRNQRSCVQ